MGTVDYGKGTTSSVLQLHDLNSGEGKAWILRATPLLYICSEHYIHGE